MEEDSGTTPTEKEKKPSEVLKRFLRRFQSRSTGDPRNRVKPQTEETPPKVTPAVTNTNLLATETARTLVSGLLLD